MVLIQDLIEHYTRHPGGYEHRQIISLAGEAKRYCLSDRCVAALIWTLTHHPGSIEKNLDCILPPDRPVWIEFANGIRTATATSSLGNTSSPPERVGYLFARNGDSDVVSLVTAWSLKESEETGLRPVFHSLAIGHMSTNRFGLQAHEARTILDGSPRAVFERLVDSVDITVPENFQREVETLAGPGQETQALFQCRFDLVAEIPFALAALIATRNEDVRVNAIDEDPLHLVDLSDKPRRSLFGRFAAPKPNGFARRGNIRKMRVGWQIPSDPIASLQIASE